MAKKGSHLSEETKRKISEARKKGTSWNKGLHWSEEIKIQMSNSNKGKLYHKEEWYRNKLSKACKGIKTWNTGLNKETDKRVCELGKKISIALKKTFNEHPEKRLNKQIYYSKNPEKHANYILAHRKGKQTNIERIIGEILKLHNIEYEFQHVIVNKLENRVKFVDFYIPKLKLIIECDEKYWHQDIVKEKERDIFILNVLGKEWSIEHLSSQEIFSLGRFMGVNIYGK